MPIPKCPFCGSKHHPTDPHKLDSLFYKKRFAKEHGREPTWADAVAHCPTRVKETWTVNLKDRNLWTETPRPIAEQTPGG